MTCCASQQPASATGLPTRALGRTGQRVSILCLGGWHIGSIEDDAEAIRIMHAAIDEGMTFFDNGWDYHDGGSEEVMGRALADGRRDKVFLMTKNCERDYEGSKQCLDDSLRRLRTDHLDLWQFHEMIYDNDPDWVFDKGGIRAALEARKAGKVRFIGFTGHKDPRIHLGHARQAIRVGHGADAGQRARRALSQLPEAGRPGLPEEAGRRHRHEGIRRRRRASSPRPGCQRQRRIATRSASRWRRRSSGMTSMEQLREASRSRGTSCRCRRRTRRRLTDRLRDVATDGRLELFKSSQMFDGPVHRRQHGFAT